MTTSEIGKKIFDDCRVFGVETYIKDTMDYSEIETERIIILTSEIQPSTYWHNCYVRINWCVPDIKGEADSIRLEEVEKLIKSLHKGIGEYEERYYRYKKHSQSTESDKEMRCHYVKLTILFQYQNIK